MWLLLFPAFGAPPPTDPAAARLAPDLRRAAVEGPEEFVDARLEPQDPEWVTVVVEGRPGLGSRLARLGHRVEAEAGDRVQVRARYGELLALAGVEGVVRVREPWRASPKAVESEGYDATMVQDWHAEGVTGKGARVAVVDVGFDGWEDLGEELPDDIETDFSRGAPESTAHGAAVAEIVSDFAPDAELLLASFSTDVEFCELMEVLVADGVDVVNGSIGFDNVWHADGTSSLSVCADFAVQNGVAYFAAAGNENDKYRVGPLAYAADGETVTLAGVDAVEVESVRGYVDLSFRWSEPFGAAQEDIDVIVTNRDGTECGRSEASQRGEEGDGPYERVNASGCSDRVTVHLTSIGGGAEVDGLEGYLYAYYGLDEQWWTNTEDLTLPGDLVDGISVGASYWDSGEAPVYTSRGPTNDGRAKPDVSAPTAVSTATYGAGQFEGSSAATPHAAGLAALWVSATRSHGDPEALKAWMTENAEDLGDPGADLVFGAGRIRGDAVPERVGLFACGCASGGVGPGMAWLVAGCLLWRRRR